MTNTALSNEVRAYVALRNWLVEQYQVNPDDPVVLDTLDGSNLQEMIGALAREARRRKAMAEALATIIGENEARKARHERAAESIRRQIAQAMTDAGMKRVEAPDATLYVRPGGEPKRKIISEDMLPSWAWKEVVTKKPDIDAIQQRPAIEQISGVGWTNPAPILTIRPT